MKFFWKHSRKAATAPPYTEVAPVVQEDDDAAIAAAIAIALRMYAYQSRAYEETIITIQKVIRPYSPWNSKIYNMKQMPHHRTPHRRLK